MCSASLLPPPPPLLVLLVLTLASPPAVDRDYAETTRAFPFKETFVAPNTTWNDRDMRGLSSHSISELAKAKLTLVYPTTVAFVRPLSPSSSALLNLVEPG